MTLPPAGELADLVRTAGPGALDAYAPEVDALADVRALADYLGVKPASIYRERSRGRWPAPDPSVPGRSPVWTYRTVIIHRAGMPGKGRWRSR